MLGSARREAEGNTRQDVLHGSLGCGAELKMACVNLYIFSIQKRKSFMQKTPKQFLPRNQDMIADNLLHMGFLLEWKLPEGTEFCLSC